MWPAFRHRISHRLAMHVPLARHRLRNDGPMVSFTFDDVPRSAAIVGASALAARGARGTFYISGSTVGAVVEQIELADVDDLMALHRRGHELGCHTYSHRQVVEMDVPAMAADIERNRRFFGSLPSSVAPKNFAYPFGVGSLRGKRWLGRKFRSGRSIMPGVNAGTVDPHFLKATPLIDRQIDPDAIDRLFDQTQATGGWLIFYTHDVADRPSYYGCSPRLLDHALDAAYRRGIVIRNVAEGLDACGV